MKLLWSYIKKCRYVVLAYALFAVIFASVFSLYRIEIEAVFYSLLLCTLLGVVIIAVSFFRYASKHKGLSIICENIELLLDELPKPSNLIEADYIEMLNNLQSIRMHEFNNAAYAKNENIDYLTAWIHQIKAPIAAMHLILQSNDTNENKELLLELFRIEQYTEMVLSYFRLDSGSSDFVFRECEIDRVIRRSIRKFAPSFVRKKISLKYDGTDAVVLTDEKWLAFIIEQLLSNAVKYTTAGSVTVEVGSDNILSISDTGIGIAREDIPRIFEKGFTGYNGRSDKKATGLGLYLCKKAADKLSINMSVSSVEGKGTTFYLDLNIDKLQAE